MWGCMCLTGPFKFRWSRGSTYNSSYCHHQFGCISLSHCCNIFVVVRNRWLHHRMLSVSYISRESWVLCLLLLCSLMMCENNRVHYDPMVVFVCLHITLPHYHHYTDKSEGIELLKCLSSTFCLECVSKIKSILSSIFHAIYRAVRIQITHDDCENTYTLSYYHHQIGSITHLPPFRVRSWNNNMRSLSFCMLSQIHVLWHTS